MLGALLGAISPSIAEFVDVPELQGWATRMGARDAGEAFLFTIVYVLGQVVSAYAIAAMLQLRSEEVELRAEHVLATPVSRLRWASSHMVFGVIGSAVVLAALGLPIGLMNGLIAGDVAGKLPRLLGRTLATLPAVWVMFGLAAALYGLLPRLTSAVWALLALFFLLEGAWEVQAVSQSVFNFSPFAHVHWAQPVTVTPLVTLTLVAAALTAIGLFGFHRRDIPTV